ncbi:Aft1 HRA domain-containing protein [Tirmania nivea]|nr:Aft1 HRA domain-containing protein [Tirmania nivea]
MSAAVARQQQQSGHGANSNTGSRMGTNSPVEKRVAVKAEASNLDKSTRSPTQTTNNRDSRILSPKSSHRRNTSGTSHPSSNIAIDQAPHTAGTTEDRSGSTTEGRPSNVNHVAPPLLPPPPAADIIEKPGDDYFNFHKNRLDQEPNPFEQSFSVGNGDSTPKAILPPASAITSPAPLIGGTSTYNFMNSLRSGPLSPAMLQGPISNGPLGFDTHHLRTGLTPNESGIRSGLTPGGSGSMFPVPSPSASGLFQLGSSTPSTMEFQRTALSAATAASALRKQPTLTSIPPPLNKPEFSVTAPDARDHNPPTAKPRQLSNAFDADPAHNAANGLYMLAQAHQQNDQYSNSTVNAPANTGITSGQPNLGSTQDDASPNSKKKRALVTNTSMTRAPGAVMTGNARGVSEMSEDMASDSEESDDDKRGSGDGKGGKRTAGRARKSDPKTNKRTKVSQGSANGSGDDQDNDNVMSENGKKMTDEEKRKNFLERNRVAALKCRQRKKQWLQNLQTKVEYYSQENDALTSQVASLREEIVALKTLLLAHKDCPIARATNMGMDTLHSALASGPTEYTNHASYSNMGVIAPPPAVHGHPTRRYS